MSPSAFPRPRAARALALLVLGALAPSGAAAQAEPSPLRVDLALELRLTPQSDGLPGLAEAGLACARTLELLAPGEGPLTVTAESFDGDVLLQRLDAEGAVLDQDDDGGVAWNARLVVDARAGERVRLRAGFKQGGGRLSCLARAGVVEPLAGEEATRAQIRFLELRARAAEERGDVLQRADDLLHAGNLAFASGDPQRCKRSYLQVRALADALHHELLGLLADAYLGTIAVGEGELDAALPQLERAIASAQRFTERGDPTGALVESFARDALGSALLARGELEQARACFERGLELARAQGQGENEAALCSKLGVVASRSARGADAAHWHERAIARARELHAPRVLAEVLLVAAQQDEKLGRYARERQRLEEALALAPNPLTRSALLGQLGGCALATGEYVEAREALERALEGARGLGERALEFAAELQLGELARVLGDAREARRRIEAALERRGDALEPRERAQALRALALACMETERSDEARALLDEALGLAQEAADPQLELSVLSTEVAECYRRADYERGRTLAERQVALARELGLTALEAVGLGNLAELELRCGRIEAARATCARALAMHEELGSRSYLQRVLLTAVELAQLEGDARAVEDALVRAEACFEERPLGIEQGALLRAREEYALWGEYGQDLVALTLAARPEPSVAREALARGFRRAGLWKGRALWQGIEQHRRGERDARSSALRREERRLRAEREERSLELAGETRAGAEQEQLERLRAELDELARRQEELAARLRERAGGDAALEAPAGLGPRELAPVLGDETALVEFVEGRKQLYAYTLWRGELRFVELGAREALRAQVRAYVEGLGERAHLLAPEPLARAGERLYRALLEPALRELPADAALVVVPSALVAGLPCEALVLSAPPHPRSCAELEFLLDRRVLCYAASSPVLALGASAAPRASAGKALLLADPLFEVEQKDAAPLLADARVPQAQTELGLPRARALERLPGTREEALAVAAALEAPAGGEPARGLELELADELGARRSASLHGNAFELLLGARASADALRGDLRGYSILHLATHGRVDREEPRRSGLVLAPDADGRRLLDLGSILELDLDLELAVLSACDTASGAQLRGEGVQSLARAFQYAGARAVVASLWPVDDLATARVMRALYARCARGGLALPRALREARLAERARAAEDATAQGEARGEAVREERPAALELGHPYYWASFVAYAAPEAAAGLTAPR